jgi:hypothetical protein
LLKILGSAPYDRFDIGSKNMNYSDLKEKQRRLRETFSDPLSLRVHRAISWLGRAEEESDDQDVQFILLWISFNAAYAGDLREELTSERSNFRNFFEVLVSLDRSNNIYDLVWQRFSQEIRVILDNQYVFSPFWSHHNGQQGYEDWEIRLAQAKKTASQAVMTKDTVKILMIVFDRLYVLRNQIVHGGATWNSSVNRAQVRDGVKILESLLPIFIDLMLDNPAFDWGKPSYPVVK